MPELPEVQTVVDTLIQAGVIGCKITKADIYWPKTVAERSPENFCKHIKNLIITTVWRRGKYIVFDFNAKLSLLIHLRMTGRLVVENKNPGRSKHVHVILHLSDGRSLQFHDTRKFGRMHLIPDSADILGKLGVEPLAPDFTAKGFKRELHARNRLLKPLLLDQSFLAGLGNIYVDEALWEAGIHPLRSSKTLQDYEIKVLHRAIRKVLRKGISNRGTSLGNGKNNFVSASERKGRNQVQLNVFRRTDLPCRRCKKSITRIIVGQRSTHVCESCQKI